MSKPIQPHSPTPHGEFMAKAYAESHGLGQLAVSYVLRHYSTTGDTLPTPTRSLTTTEELTLQSLARGLTQAEEVEERGIRPQSLATDHARLYKKLGVSNKIAAVRRSIELGIVTVTPLSNHDKPLSLEPYDLTVFDLLSRVSTSQEVGRLTGYGPGTVRNTSVIRLLAGLGIAVERKPQAITHLYELGVFTKGLPYKLDDYPMVREIFDEKLGREQPILPRIPK